MRRARVRIPLLTVAVRLLPAAVVTCLTVAGALATVARAQPAADASIVGGHSVVETPAAIEEIQVSGERPGPGLWKVRRGENTVYVLGTTSPLPRKMKFRSRELERVLSEAGLFIPTRPSVDVKAGPFRLIGLYRDWRKLRLNPGGVGLDAVLPPELYARFREARLRYAPRNRKLEELRPLIAAGDLYRAAIESVGLDIDSDVSDEVRRLARRAKVPVWEAEQRIDDPRALLAEIGRVSPSAEQACLATTLTRIERDRLVLDLRTVLPEEDDALAGCLRRALAVTCAS